MSAKRESKKLLKAQYSENLRLHVSSPDYCWERQKQYTVPTLSLNSKITAWWIASHEIKRRIF